VACLAAIASASAGANLWLKHHPSMLNLFSLKPPAIFADK
jgi:hypothetical protein